MACADRRQRLALDQAYRLFRQVIKEEVPPDLFELVKCIKTVSNALQSNGIGQFKLTVTLWKRIYESLFDTLITNFPAHIAIYAGDGKPLQLKESIPEEAVLELHPDGLRRKDDVFRIAFCNLNPMTKRRLSKVWNERRGHIKQEDFLDLTCDGVCVPKGLIIGADVLKRESELGKEKAYRRWWELYWQAYCVSDQLAKCSFEKEMSSLEAVWGNLYY